VSSMQTEFGIGTFIHSASNIQIPRTCIHGFTEGASCFLAPTYHKMSSRDGTPNRRLLIFKCGYAWLCNHHSSCFPYEEAWRTEKNTASKLQMVGQKVLKRTGIAHSHAIATRLRAGCSRSQHSILIRARNLSLLQNVQMGSRPMQSPIQWAPGLKWQALEADHSAPSRAELRNVEAKLFLHSLVRIYGKVLNCLKSGTCIF
jgi:hypothetical protein